MYYYFCDDHLRWANAIFHNKCNWSFCFHVYFPFLSFFRSFICGLWHAPLITPLPSSSSSPHYQHQDQPLPSSLVLPPLSLSLSLSLSPIALMAGQSRRGGGVRAPWRILHYIIPSKATNHHAFRHISFALLLNFCVGIVSAPARERDH